MSPALIYQDEVTDIFSLGYHCSPGCPQELLPLGCLQAPFLPVRLRVRSIRPNSPHTLGLLTETPPTTFR